MKIFRDGRLGIRHCLLLLAAYFIIENELTMAVLSAAEAQPPPVPAVVLPGAVTEKMKEITDAITAAKGVIVEAGVVAKRAKTAQAEQLAAEKEKTRGLEAEKVAWGRERGQLTEAADTAQREKREAGEQNAHAVAEVKEQMRLAATAHQEVTARIAGENAAALRARDESHARALEELRVANAATLLVKTEELAREKEGRAADVARLRQERIDAERILNEACAREKGVLENAFIAELEKLKPAIEQLKAASLEAING